jgi:hypothetical protein
MSAAPETIIREMASKFIADEIDFRLNGIERDPADHEDGWTYTYMDAFNDTVGFIEQNDCFKGSKDLCNIREIQIALGWYREVSEEELSRTFVTSGKKYSFKLGGKKYTWVGRASDY